MARLEGAFALLVKSAHHPGELVACKRGSPLILGLRAAGGGASGCGGGGAAAGAAGGGGQGQGQAAAAASSAAASSAGFECFLASDASAVVEHTKK